MLAALHARYDRLPEPHRELALLAIIAALLLGIGQEYSRAVSLASLGVLSFLIGARLRYMRED